MKLTAHAAARCQQRSIPPLIREWLMDYGAEVKAHGATKRFFDKAARRRLAASVGAEVVDRMGNLLNHYLVQTDAVVVTAGIRNHRVRRP